MKRFGFVTLAIVLAAVLCGAAAAQDKGPAYTFKWSGYAKADLSYDQTRVNAGDYVLFVNYAALDAEKNGVTNLTARETRLGFDFSWKENDITTDAKVEFDFYGLGVSSASLNSQENKGAPMLRHAYVQVSKGHWSMLAGQTSDVISPLVPKTVNYIVMWDQGNIGYRRPQFRMSAWGKPNDKMKVTATAAVMRTLGGDLNADKVDDGADAPFPTIGGRFGLAFSSGAPTSAEFGFSGHYGKEEYTAAGEDKSLASWSANIDFKLTCCDKVELLGEYFVGQHLAAYMGGFGYYSAGTFSSINPLKNEIGSAGGWAMVTVKPHKKLSLNLGFSVDNPAKEDFEMPADTLSYTFVDMNSCITGNVMYSLTSTVQAMFEVAQFATNYLDINNATDVETENKQDDLRIQFAIKATFK